MREVSPRFPSRALRCLAWSLLVVSADSALGLDPQRGVTQYGLQIWREPEGLPHTSIQAIAQTADGYLWLGTQAGLARFDGVRLTTFDGTNTTALKKDYIVSLCAGRNGALWIGTRGGGLVALRDGVFRRYGMESGLPNENVWALYEDRGGRLWIGTEAGLARLDGERVIRVWKAPEGRVPQVLSIAETGDGLWFGTGGGLYRMKDGLVAGFTKRDGLLGDVVLCLHTDTEGVLWIGTTEGLTTWKSGRLQDPLPVKEGSRVVAICKDRDGNLWVAAYGAGLLRIRDGHSDQLAKKQGLPTDFVRAICEDREGNLWIGTEGGGLTRLKDGSFTPYGVPEGMSNELATGIAQDRTGSLWIGTFGGGLFRLRDGEFTNFTSKDGLASDMVMAIREDHEGNLWIGCEFGGLSRFRNGKLEPYEIGEGSRKTRVRDLLEDRQGNLWIATSGPGLMRVKDGTATTLGPKEGVSDRRIMTLLEDREGTIWIGTRDAGLNRFRDGRFTVYGPKEGLPGDGVVALFEDREGSLWIGTDGGLSLLKANKLSRFGVKDGLLDKGILSIVEDDLGYLWMGTIKGIFRVRKKDLIDFADGKIRALPSASYSMADGMRTNECDHAQPAAWKARDGNLWFSTVRGVVSVDPRRLQTNKIPPPIVIEEVVADGKQLDLRRPARVPPGRGRLEIRYTANSFRNPDKVRFRYKLEGLDDWMDAGPRRMASYSNLPPGSYVFRVIGANEDGVWNQTGAAFAFRLEPHFYQTIWFKTLTAAAAVLFVWSLWRLRRRRAEAEFSAVLAERTRVSRELHDTLTQGFAGISVQLEAAGELLSSAPDRAKVHLARARDLARSSLAEAHRSVLDLRPKLLEGSDLAGALSKITQELTEDLRIRTQFEVKGAPRPLPRTVEENLLRIGQEALTNTLRHAGASTIRVELRFDRNSVTLRVTDDGRGFDPGAGDANRQGRLGIVGMRERAEQLEAQLDVKSSPGKGTEISVTVPIR